MIALNQANILDWARAYTGPKFHALLCDPPYHLTEITKRFGSADAAPAQYGTDGAFQRASRGFMGKEWDGGDIAYQPATWAALAKHLHPGAFGMAFSGSRGWHRMAVAIEDAGLIIHPTIFCWAYGSGFPKATRLDVALDRRAGAERATVGTRKHQPKFAAAELGYREKDNGYNSRDRQSFDVTAPATAAAAAWAGHRYGGQALKPAIEPIIVFQKPYAGRPLDSITATGAGALWIDGGRIETDEDARAPQSDPSRRAGVVGGDLGFSRTSTEAMQAAQRESIERMNSMGRWPANFALVHHPACAAACHPDCTVLRLGAQSGESEAKASQRGTFKGMFGGIEPSSTWVGESTLRGHDDTGTAARFFYNADWMAERLEAADQVGYHAKASRAEREAGLDPRTLALLGLDDADDFDEATINDGRAKSIDNPYQRGETVRRNIHATVKPISLARWLATLLLPPPEYGPRRLLVPFAGVASEMIGAMLAGWEDVEGIELGADHVEIGRARLAYWQQRRYELLDPAAPLTVKAAPEAPRGQMDMFYEEKAA